MELLRTEYFIPLCAAFAAALTAREIATLKNRITLKYVFTPVVTGLVAGFAVLAISEDGGSPYRSLVLAGILCSLVADTLMMIVEADLMKNGIVFFALAHVMYISAFSLSYAFSWWNLGLAAALLALLAPLYRGIEKTAGSMKTPIMAYAALLGTMLFFALSHLNGPVGRRGILVMAGALLFVVSDFLIVYLTFIRPHRQESVIVWAVYAPAQLLIALSCFS